MSSQYLGVKFRVIPNSDNKASDSRIAELIKWAKIFHQHGLAPLYEGGSYGNLSFRWKQGDNSFFITASHTALNKALTSENFVQVLDCDLENNLVYTRGTDEPSSETMLHYALYKKRNDINCILHGHCSKILAAASRKNLLSTEKQAEYGTADLVQEVIKIAELGNFLIMKDHGFLALGRTIDEAGDISLEMLKECSSKQ